MTVVARVAALERRRGLDDAWMVIGEGRDDRAIVYTVCGRWPGEPSQRMTAAEYARFAATHSVRLLRLYITGSGEL